MKRLKNFSLKDQAETSESGKVHSLPKRICHSAVIEIIQNGNELEILPASPQKALNALRAEASLRESHHNRSDTTLIKDINQSYQFISALKNYSEEDPVPNDIESSPEIYSSKSSFSYPSGIKLKPDKNISDVTFSSFTAKNSLVETRDNLQSFMFCPVCRKYVATVTKFEAPVLPLWKRLFCSDCFSQTRSYNIIKCCRFCMLVLEESKSSDRL